jgi:CheY-like chemotaxis protein
MVTRDHLRKILIIDGSDPCQRLYSMILRPLRRDDIAIYHAYDGLEALKVLHRNPDIDLVIMDIELPSLSGLDLLRLRESDDFFGAIPIIVVSANGSPETIAEVRSTGVAAFLSKPLKPDDLHRVIGRLFPHRYRVVGGEGSAPQASCGAGEVSGQGSLPN